jgi:hypothetical protein
VILDEAPERSRANLRLRTVWVETPQHAGTDRPGVHSRGVSHGGPVRNSRSCLRDGLVACCRRWWSLGPRFFDQILRDDEDLERYRAYIRENPSRWRPPQSDLEENQ